MREYDGAARAANGMGASWRQLSTDATMKANKGYIIQFAQSSGFDSYNAASGMEALFNRQAVTIDLPAHTSTVPADANWNLVGKPFPCYSEIDVAIIPGMSFDNDGNRLGRGKGYYDRLLAKIPQTYKIGMCFDFQKVEEVPTEETDIRMDEVL